MNYQQTFKRYEMKYLLTLSQKERILEAMVPFMQLDRYGRSGICNIYFDDDSFRLIRRSLEKPLYKEKLRLRSYGPVQPGQPVFVELKKKFDGVVYKRRLQLPEERVLQAFRAGTPLPEQSQIAREIDCFRAHYGHLAPKVFLSYEREAYYSLDGRDLRITFDDRICYRTQDLSLTCQPGGTAILDPELVLMEIKTGGGMPLWLTKVLTENRIFKTSYSKYGNAYLDLQKKGERIYARNL